MDVKVFNFPFFWNRMTTYFKLKILYFIEFLDTTVKLTCHITNFNGFSKNYFKLKMRDKDDKVFLDILKKKKKLY